MVTIKTDQIVLRALRSAKTLFESNSSLENKSSEELASLKRERALFIVSALSAATLIQDETARTSAIRLFGQL